MIRKKSFDIFKSGQFKSKRMEKLYQPKKWRWCKYFGIPLLIAFVMLMILTNVDLSWKSSNKTYAEEKYNAEIVRKDIPKKRIIKSARAFKCSDDNVNCAVICNGINTNNIYKELEYMHALCGAATELYLHNCYFPAGAMKPKFLQGDFNLRTLAIIDCNLSSIEANAFQHDTVSTLKNLHLINTNLATLRSFTFEGLKALEILNITNTAYTFEGNQFIKPLASSLKKIKFLQMPLGNVIYDPLPWMQGADMLRVQELNFQNNNFKGKLTGQTFVNMFNVEILNLSECNLDFLPVDVFDKMLHTLKYLDLSGNQFKTLPLALVGKLEKLEVFNLGNNNWDCSCEHIEFMGKVNVKDMEALQCSTPPELKDVHVMQVLTQCYGNTTTLPTTTVTPGNSTSSSSTITKETTTTSSISNTTESMEPESTTTTGETTEANTTSSKPSRTTSAYETTTTERITTTRFTESTATSSSPSYGDIHCWDPNQNKTITLGLLKALAEFNISYYSATSISLTFQQDIAEIDLIYFTNYTNAVQLSNKSARHLEFKIIIHNLKYRTAYVFCIVGKYRWSISPFDCKSFMILHEQTTNIWIRTSDQAWIIALIFLGICLFIFLGIIFVFTFRRLRNRRNFKERALKNNLVHHDSSGISRNNRNSQNPLTGIVAQRQRQMTQPDICAGCPQNYSGGVATTQSYYEEM